MQTGSSLEDETEAFEALKPRLAELWTRVFPKDDEPYTSVIVPSLTVDAGDPAAQAGRRFHEETLLFLLVRLRNPCARVVYVTSQPIPPFVLDYYFQFLAGIPASHAAARLTLVSAHDTSARPLTEKVLERPRLLDRIRRAIPDLSRAYLTVFRATALERRLAIRLGIPLNAADPALEPLCAKSSARRILAQAGVEVPAGFDGLRDEHDLIEALHALERSRPRLARAVVKLERSHWDEGHAVVALPASGRREDLQRALAAASVAGGTAESFLDRFDRTGGVAEEFVEGVQKAVSGQVRINPLHQVILTSTHDELRGGRTGLESVGCVFPADERWRRAVQEAAMGVGRLLAGKGLVSRLSVEFLAGVDESGQRRLLGTEINLGVGGSTHPLLAVRFLTGGSLDPLSGLFLSPAGRAKFYRATDDLRSEAYRRLIPEDLIEILTLARLHYSAHGETGALFYMLGAISELGRVGMVAVGDSPDEADSVFAQAVAALDAATG